MILEARTLRGKLRPQSSLSNGAPLWPNDACLHLKHHLHQCLSWAIAQNASNGSLAAEFHIISVHVGRCTCSSMSEIACNVCNVQIPPLGGIYSPLSYSAGCESVFRGLLCKGNVAEKSFRGT